MRTFGDCGGGRAVKATCGPVLVVGATGFVGRAIASALEAGGNEVVRLRAPRITGHWAEDRVETIRALRGSIDGCAAVVNAAGVADASGTHSDVLFGANAVLPGLIAEAAARERARFVHVSSASVQGRRRVLDSSNSVAPFSPYTRSKLGGERAVASYGRDSVIYRPPGVHGPGRQVTRSLAHLAASPLSSVAGRGDRPSANVLVQSVGAAVAHLALTDATPPPVVHHPSEGMTTESILRLLGGRRPKRIPVALARAVVLAGLVLGRSHPRVLANARRLEMLWFGQAQAPSWLEVDGWRSPTTPEDWRALGESLRSANTKDPEERV